MTSRELLFRENKLLLFRENKLLFFSWGRIFYSFLPMSGNGLRNPADSEQNVLFGKNGTMRSLTENGASLFKSLNLSKRNMKSILFLTIRKQ